MAAHVEHAGAAGRGERGGPNMTAMVDVVMCILIFFMLGSSLLTERYLTAPLPAIGGGPGAAATLPPVRTTIKLTRIANDTWVSAFDAPAMKMNRVGDREQSQNRALSEFFSAKSGTLSPDVQIIIQPEAGVPYQDVITVYDSCIKAQFKQVAFTPAW